MHLVCTAGSNGKVGLSSLFVFAPFYSRAPNDHNRSSKSCGTSKKTFLFHITCYTVKILNVKNAFRCGDKQKRITANKSMLTIKRLKHLQMYLFIYLMQLACSLSLRFNLQHLKSNLIFQMLTTATLTTTYCVLIFLPRRVFIYLFVLILGRIKLTKLGNVL